MANRLILGKNVNTNHGHSSASAGFGLYVSRTGKDVTSCTADELIFNTDNGSVTDVSRVIGMFQLAPITTSNASTTTTAVSSGATATIDLSSISFNRAFGFIGYGRLSISTSSSTSAAFNITENFANETITITNNTTQSLSVKSYVAPRYSNLALF